MGGVRFQSSHCLMFVALRYYFSTVPAHVPLRDDHRLSGTMIPEIKCFLILVALVNASLHSHRTVTKAKGILKVMKSTITLPLVNKKIIECILNLAMDSQRPSHFFRMKN